MSERSVWNSMSSYDRAGPFGAKSIGEISYHTPSPAISNAVQNAVGVIVRELPITAEKCIKEWRKKNKSKYVKASI